ncbi:MAG: hypothetical protein IT383_10755 [Deltaproteobacteria bacterium]|nr:hypothetical protein [Deltaproteobacteria bacterium]
MLALTVALLAPTMACINPFYIEGVRPPTNHAPTGEAISPAFKFEPNLAPFGDACRPLVVNIVNLFDADLDTLTVRVTLLLKRNGGALEGVRERLFEDELVPVENQEGELVYDFVPLELTESLLRSEVGDLDAQVAPGNTLTQLLEVRISDGGFVPGEETPREGAGLLAFSWLVDLDDSACPLEGGGS